MAIEIVIADDHEIVRIGLKALFGQSDIHVIAEASDGAGAYKAAKKYSPDLVLLDVRMPNGDGLTCLTQIKLELPETPVLLFSGYNNPMYMARAVALGAAGYLSKEASPAEIVHAIRAAAVGDTVWSLENSRRATAALTAPRGIPDAEVPLTGREADVLALLGCGLTNIEIARSLGIGYETVKEYVHNILRKIGVKDRTKAAIWAIRRDLA